MQEQERLNGADQEFEAALSSLAPMEVQIDPVAAAYSAGRRSARRQVRTWQSAAAMMLVVSAAMWVAPVARDGMVLGPSQATTPFAGRSERATQLVAVPFASQSFVALQAAMREHGVDGLPVVELPATQLTRIDNRL
jgi:hypothetical protein